jgi:hypothetical protein
MGLGGERAKPHRFVIGGRRVRMNGDGTYSRFTRPPAEKEKAARAKARKHAKAARKANR